MSLTKYDEFSPVWISSIKHMEAFKQIYNENSKWRKYITGSYRIPEGFPYVKQRLYFWMKTPIVFFSNGILTVEKDELTFKAKPYKIFLGIFNKFCNLLLNHIIHLKPDDLITIERYKYPEPPLRRIGKYHNIEWVRVKTKENIFDGDFLMCAGGKGPFMGKIRKKTDNLYNTLLEFREQ